MTDHERNLERIEACRELYIKYRGKKHEQIEREMRSAGYDDFHRRMLYRRYENGRAASGWIERYGWDGLLKEEGEKGSGGEGENESVGDGEAVQPEFAVPAPQLPVSPTPCLPPDPAKEEYDEFKQWLISVSPNMTWTAKHQLYLYKRLRRMTEGDLKRLMIFMPPRHGKSELVTVRYAAWRLKKDPAMRTIIASYGQKLANTFSRGIKSVLIDDAMLSREREAAEEILPQINAESADQKPLRSASSAPICGKNSSLPAIAGESGSPFPFARPRFKNTESEWETTMGGGLKAVGVGAGITGFGANLIVIDDPVKNREQANSLTYRDKVWNWWNNDLYTRLEPGGQVVLIQTRWHEDDLAGRLLRQMDEGGEQWEVVDLPALAEAANQLRIENGELRMKEREDGNDLRVENGEMSLKGTKIIAQGKADGRNPGSAAQDDPDPEGVALGAGRVAPLQGAEVSEPDVPGVPPKRLHPRLLSLSPSATKSGIDVLGRRFGDALWPERFPVAELERTREQIGTWSFASLYQQRPSPAEGGIFKRDWFRQVINAPPPGLKWVRAYDLACSAGATSDYTASFRVAVDKEQNIYIDGGFRRKIEYPEQRRYILGRIAAEPGASHIVELSANGHAVLADLGREKQTLGRALRGIKPRGDKHSRAIGWMAAAEAGRVFLIRGHWNHDLVEEAAAFPTGTHDDQIDAISLAVQGLSERKEFVGSF